MEVRGIDQALERVNPRDGHGHLIMSEHLGRYLWASQLVSDAEVLDAGCGTGYGTKILVDAGASRVVGVDISDTAIKEASTYSSSQVELRRCDLQDLPFRDGEFDLVVCFEVIEHVQNRDAILDELKRVVKADGILCVSTPNSSVYPSGNPYHIHEYTPEEFIKALTKRFNNVEAHRQSAWLTSAILSDIEFIGQGIDDVFSGNTFKLDNKQLGDEIFTIALATSGSIPPTLPTVVLGEPFEVGWWQQQIQSSKENSEAQLNEARRQVHQANLAVEKSDSHRLSSVKRLLEVEELLLQLNARVLALEQELDIRADRIDALSQRADRADRVVAGMKSSISWRLTAPLRALKGSR